MQSYKELGLSNTKGMYAKAVSGKFAVPGYNFNNMEQLQAIMTACIETKSPVILQVSKGARDYANQILLKHMARGSMEIVKASGVNIPVALHLDHGDSYELCVSCVESGFSSVMIDGSGKSFQENIELTKKVVKYAHDHDVSVEGELGVLAGIEDEVSHEKTHYTKPEEVQEFVSKTGVDSLAISIGTSHGAYKFKLKPGESVPPLRFDILEEIEKLIPGFPIVLHGASSVMPKYVDMINKYGGKMENAVGVPEEQLRRAASSAVCKINIDSDGRLAMTAKIREVFAVKPGEFDPRKYLGPARAELIEMYKHKNINVLGSAGKA
ncbi:fructose-1,6-bisphosphate aldolase [Candidatus Omnitrophus magneticus]|uniref:Fructose-1,6-bisphosphate aldolase n=1 Tax=Candidatus Omnitrophus magneticus TaxID=1609969 RepID=A0A0F0CPB0_9BACT|nr:fructose-1,6-bisphosphate aldolase [Candidatus Omnitrophus magneticus]